MKREQGSGKVYSVTSGIPLLYAFTCSSFPLIHPYTGILMMATATHCIFGNQPDKYSDYATSGGSIMGVQNYLAKGINISEDYHKEFSYITDILLTAIPDEKADIFGLENAFTMAEHLPERGDIIYMEGYKGYNIPFVAGLTWGTRVSCTYMGKFYDFHTKPVFAKANSIVKRFDINDYVYCPKGKVGEGMSGGPMTNTKGEVIGVNTRYIALDEAQNMDYDVFVFSSLTKSDYEFEDRENLLPLRDGQYTFANVNSIGKAPKKYKGKQCILGGTSKTITANFKNGFLDGDMTTYLATKEVNLVFTKFEMGLPYRFKVIGGLKTGRDLKREENLRSPCHPQFDPGVDGRELFGGLFMPFDDEYSPDLEDQFAKMDKSTWAVFDENNEQYRDLFLEKWRRMTENFKRNKNLPIIPEEDRVLRNYDKYNEY